MGELILKEDALNCFHDWIDRYGCEHTADEDAVYQRIAELSAVQPNKDVIDDCLYHIYKNISVHTTTVGVIAIRYYMEKLYETYIERGKTVVDEMISRRAAIDLFPDDDLEYDTKGGYIAPHLARRMICELPFAQPDHVADVSKKVDVDDCISRRVVKKKLEQNLAYMRVFGVDRCLGLIDEIPAVEPESKWISCEEKMPEEDLWTGASQQYSYGVLMYVLDDDGEEMIDFGHTIDGKWYSDTADTYVENSSNWKVIAWMLPPSYKENE